jgi:uncharacterized protein
LRHGGPAAHLVHAVCSLHGRPRGGEVTPLEIGAVLAAGLAAGTINTIVGSGSLITFPTLLAFGLSPLQANVTNTVGLVPGAISGAVGYRRELGGQRNRAIRLGAVSTAGGITGGVLLLWLPSSAFDAIVPFLILFAVILVALQPRLSRAMAARRDRSTESGREHPIPLVLGIYLTGIYGGYFGAAQGVILIALLGIFLSDDLQRLNGLKNVLGALVNGVAAVLFIVKASIDWPVAITLAIGAICGGQLGAYVGRRLSPLYLRGFIIIIGTVVAVKLLIG